jgi:hypothetical protein
MSGYRAADRPAQPHCPHRRPSGKKTAGRGSTPGEAQVRAILKACVEWFNAKNAQAGDVIETEEREDICDLLYRLAVVAGHLSLIEETDQWRKW